MVKEWTLKDFERTCTKKMKCGCHSKDSIDPEHCCINCMGDEYYEDAFSNYSEVKSS